ncbi:LacI family DNA-binding transcriptional regulator [Hymenobacter saemangeumensis]|uniref:LacI family DNA-binding transcriptional regulator n=1 Tax=Hymenobacter saemangeumensis TaxID=1084522 RepID=A0ABP8I7W2_9BACT
MDPVTIKDIARALNLSTSTVSRALRDSYEISPETKRLVMDYAERINYRPNPIALSLKGSSSRALGVVVPQIANNFFSQAINGIEAIAYNRGYHVIIFQTHESYERELANIQQAVSRRVDGLLISLSSETSDVSHLKALQAQGLPLVLFDRVADELNVAQVVADNFGGAYAATSHLLQTGRRRIAHLTIPPYMSITQERLAGYRAALEQYGVPYDENLVRYGTFGPDEADQLVEDLLSQTPRPDAFFTASDRLALGCLTALHRRGIAIPDDISLIGFTNLPAAELLNPPMSTVTQPAQEIGELAAERLIEQIERKHKASPPSTTKLPTGLNVRDSSRLVKTVV